MGSGFWVPESLLVVRLGRNKGCIGFRSNKVSRVYNTYRAANLQLGA